MPKKRTALAQGVIFNGDPGLRITPQVPELARYIDENSKGVYRNPYEQPHLDTAPRSESRKIVLGALNTLALTQCCPEAVTAYLRTQIRQARLLSGKLSHIDEIGGKIFAALSNATGVMYQPLAAVSNEAHHLGHKLSELQATGGAIRRKPDEELSARALQFAAYDTTLPALTAVTEHYFDLLTCAGLQVDSYTDPQALAAAAKSLAPGMRDDGFLYPRYLREAENTKISDASCVPDADYSAVTVGAPVKELLMA